MIGPADSDGGDIGSTKKLKRFGLLTGGSANQNRKGQRKPSSRSRCLGSDKLGFGPVPGNRNRPTSLPEVSMLPYISFSITIRENNY